MVVAHTLNALDDGGFVYNCEIPAKKHIHIESHSYVRMTIIAEKLMVLNVVCVYLSSILIRGCICGFKNALDLKFK